MATSATAGRWIGHLSFCYRSLCPQTFHRRILPHHCQEQTQTKTSRSFYRASTRYSATDVAPNRWTHQNRVQEIAEERGFKAAHKRDSLGVYFCRWTIARFTPRTAGEQHPPRQIFRWNETSLHITRRLSFLYHRSTTGLGIDLNRAVFVKIYFPKKIKWYWVI